MTTAVQAPRRTAADFPEDFNPAADSAVAAGRGDIFTDVGEWVVLATVPGLDGTPQPISDRACRIYWLLRAHVNHKTREGDGPSNRAFPMLSSLAQMIGIKKSDSISVAIKELVEIGAVEVSVQRFKGGMRQRNIYTVNREAPPGYAGLRSTNEWHASRRTTGEI